MTVTIKPGAKIRVKLTGRGWARFGRPAEEVREATVAASQDRGREASVDIVIPWPDHWTRAYSGGATEVQVPAIISTPRDDMNTVEVLESEHTPGQRWH